jgi:hypothetical protein
MTATKRTAEITQSGEISRRDRISAWDMDGTNLGVGRETAGNATGAACTLYGIRFPRPWPSGRGRHAQLWKMRMLYTTPDPASLSFATRYRIAQGYRTIDDSVMWNIATRRVLQLLAEREAVLFA